VSFLPRSLLIHSVLLLKSSVIFLPGSLLVHSFLSLVAMEFFAAKAFLPLSPGTERGMVDEYLWRRFTLVEIVTTSPSGE